MPGVGGNGGAHHPVLRNCLLQSKWAQMKGKMDGELVPYLLKGYLAKNVNIFS